jgi:hypothetical protein
MEFVALDEDKTEMQRTLRPRSSSLLSC